MKAEIWQHKKSGKKVFIVSWDQTMDVVEYNDLWTADLGPASRKKTRSMRIDNFSRQYKKTDETVEVGF